MAKKQLRKLLGLSIFIKCDFYDPIDRPIRHNLGFDDVSLYFGSSSADVLMGHNRHT